MLGIQNYKPLYLSDPDIFCKKFHIQLNELIGKSIDRFWIMWDDKLNEWNPDGPVIVEIGGNNLEFSAYNLDEFSLTVNAINLDDELDWYEMGNELPLSWKENGKTELIQLLNRPIKEVNILAYNFTSEESNCQVDYKEVDELYRNGFVLHGLEFILCKENDSDKENYFSIYNALDENGLKNREVNDYNGLKKIQITSYNIIYSKLGD